MKTRVKFVLLENEVLAIFPDILEGYQERAGTLGKVKMVSSYMRIGQHSACDAKLTLLTSASAEQYAALKKELESAPFNYELEVIGE